MIEVKTDVELLQALVELAQIRSKQWSFVAEGRFLPDCINELYDADPEEGKLMVAYIKDLESRAFSLAARLECPSTERMTNGQEKKPNQSKDE